MLLLCRFESLDRLLLLVVMVGRLYIVKLVLVTFGELRYQNASLMVIALAQALVGKLVPLIVPLQTPMARVMLASVVRPTMLLTVRTRERLVLAHRLQGMKPLLLLVSVWALLGDRLLRSLVCIPIVGTALSE